MKKKLLFIGLMVLSLLTGCKKENICPYFMEGEDCKTEFRSQFTGRYHGILTSIIFDDQTNGFITDSMALSLNVVPGEQLNELVLSPATNSIFRVVSIHFPKQTENYFNIVADEQVVEGYFTNNAGFGSLNSNQLEMTIYAADKSAEKRPVTIRFSGTKE